MKVVPLPARVSKVIVPLCLSTTTERAMAKPCPVPLPTSFVVKNGSKTMCQMLSGMPVAVSVMRISAHSPTRQDTIEMAPFARAPDPSPTHGRHSDHVEDHLVERPRRQGTGEVGR